jgi:hypothetical protein
VYGGERLGGATGWNAILHITPADQFFHDAPTAAFPVSWHDTESGVFTVAVAAVHSGFGPLHANPAQKPVSLAVLTGLAALLVDSYLY